MSGVGFGSDSGKANSTTTAGISGVAGDSSKRTGDKEQGIAQIFNKDQVKAEVNAQTAITSEFGKNASKAVGDYAATKLKEAEANNDQAGIAAWREGGSARVALHAVVGGLTGGVQGAVGAGAASAAAPSIEALQNKLQEGLKTAGLGEGASKAIASLASGTTAAAIGAAASGGTLAGGATAFNADMNNRQLHPSERQKAKDLAAKSGGKYTTEQIENALRSSANNETGESIVAGMVVDPKERNAIFDKGAVWTTGEDGKLVQVIPPKPDPELANYIKQNTGSTYSWYSPPATTTTPSNAQRDKLTNLPLDEKGRYSQTVVLDGKAYEPKYLPCATAQCIASGQNLDMTDPATRAYTKALDAQVFKDIGTGATAGTLATPVGVGGRLLFALGAAASGGQVAMSNTLTEAGFDEIMKAASEKGGAVFFEEVLGQTPAAAARASALINLSGGWDAFVNRTKIDLFGMKANDAKK